MCTISWARSCCCLDQGWRPGGPLSSPPASICGSRPLQSRGSGWLEAADPERATASLFGFYLLVAGLHSLWDAAQPIAVWLMLLLTASPMQWQLLRVGQIPSVTQGQVHLFTVLYWALLALTAVIGLLVLRGRWRRATALDRPATSISFMPATGGRSQ